MTEVTAEVVTITPAEAKDFLNLNVNNRRIRPKVNERYVRDMQAGAWPVNGASIVLDPDGAILDGQHRLSACVEADVPFTTVIVCGVEQAARLTIDNGAPRNLADFLAWQGETLAVELSAAINMAWMLEHGGPAVGSTPTYHETLVWLEENPDIRWATGLGRQVRPEAHVPGSILAGVLYLASSGVDQDRCEEFARQVGVGVDITEESPAFILRAWADRAAGYRHRPTRWDKAYAIIRAWNAFAEGRTIQPRTVAWGKGTPFPAITGSPSGHRAYRPNTDMAQVLEGGPNITENVMLVDTAGHGGVQA